MTVKYEKYLQVLADSFKQIFEKMSKQQIDSFTVKSIKESDVDDYAVGVVVPYEDEKDRLAGKFLLGLSDKEKALHLASTIAKESGLPAISEFDDMAADILYEFMNTVVGQTITEWDNLGLSVAFGTPLSLDGEKIEKTLNPFSIRAIVYPMGIPFNSAMMKPEGHSEKIVRKNPSG